jgi:shikimate kinase
MNEETRALILGRCTAIWLDGDVEMLAERASRSGKRPLLDKEDPAASLRALARLRNPVYAQAHHRIESDRPHDETVAAIVAVLSSSCLPR